MMSNAAKRSILRWIHLILAIPIVGYAYSPFAELPSYAPIVRYIAFTQRGRKRLEKPSKHASRTSGHCATA